MHGNRAVAEAQFFCDQRIRHGLDWPGAAELFWERRGQAGRGERAQQLSRTVSRAFGLAAIRAQMFTGQAARQFANLFLLLGWGKIGHGVYILSMIMALAVPPPSQIVCRP